jgi:hypothetical protein
MATYWECVPPSKCSRFVGLCIKLSTNVYSNGWAQAPAIGDGRVADVQGRVWLELDLTPGIEL